MKTVVAERIGNRRGVTLALVAVCLAALLGIGALAVDLGMLYKWHNDAQRAADAAALAGASAFVDNNVPLDARDEARLRALRYAKNNYVGGTYVNIDSTGGGTTVYGTRWLVRTKEASVEVIPDEYKVRVRIRRSGVGTWFARILGINTAGVGAKAAAEAVDAGGTKCVKPFALPDTWNDPTNDANANRLWDTNEDWSYDPGQGDTYRPYKGDPAKYGNITETGYGSAFRDYSVDPSGKTYTGDKGRQITIKPQDPNQPYVIKPGVFYPWDMPDDTTNHSTCGIGNGGGNAGAQDYSRNICSCNNMTIALGDSFPIKNGNMVGPTRFGIGDLIQLDPSAQWDQSLNNGEGGVKNSNKGPDNWLDSPRVIKIALYDPIEMQKSGKQWVKFNNISLMFVENYNKSDDAVTGRFITYATGSAEPSPATGPLIKVLRLVE